MRSRICAQCAAGQTRTKKVTELNNKIAKRGEYQSGQRFLSGSVPRLIRHVAPCKTAGGESPSLPAGKDQKPLRVFEGRALISAEGAVPSVLQMNAPSAEPFDQESIRLLIEFVQILDRIDRRIHPHEVL
jgi:hypothetical protein